MKGVTEFYNSSVTFASLSSCNFIIINKYTENVCLFDRRYFIFQIFAADASKNFARATETRQSTYCSEMGICGDFQFHGEVKITIVRVTGFSRTGRIPQLDST